MNLLFNKDSKEAFEKAEQLIEIQGEIIEEIYERCFKISQEYPDFENMGKRQLYFLIGEREVAITILNIIRRGSKKIIKEAV